MHSERHLSKSELRSCMDLGKALTSELDPDRLFNIILKKLANLVPADVLALLLFVRNDSYLQLTSSIGLNLVVEETIRIAPGEQIAGRVALTGVPEVLESSKQLPIREAWLEELVGHDTRSIICAPLIFGSRILGVLEAFNVPRNLKKALSIMMFVADYAAIAVENTRRYQEIQDLANHDNLTGLYNTRYLYAALESLCEEHKNTHSPFSLIFMDLDNFKQTVDTHGHLNGSQAIKEVAATIRDALIPPCFGVSYGGDEFVVVLPCYDKRAAIEKAEEIRGLMSRTVYLSNKGKNIRLTASFGVASFPEDARNITHLLSVADKAMFTVKNKGKNSVGSGY